MRLRCVDSEPLILMVKQRPCLYDPKSEDYTNREVKMEAWNEIARSLVGDAWSSLSDSERETTRHDIKVRWKSLKDAYIRSLRTRNLSGRFHRPYVYEKHIKFLKTIHFGVKCPEEEVGDYTFREDSDSQFEVDEAYRILQPGVEHDESSTSFHEAVEDPLKESRTEQEPTESQEDGGQHRSKRKRLKVEEPSSLSFLQESTSAVELDPNTIPSYIDEDKFFLLSLLPQLKEMSQVEKLDFKINVMQLLKANVISRNNNLNRSS